MFALTRFLIAFGGAQVLPLPDPVLGIPLRLGVLVVGIIELAVALLCLFGKRMEFQAGCVAWLGVNYVVYRIGVQMMGAQHEAMAIGGLTDPLQLTRGFIGTTAGLAPICLLIGGSASTTWFWVAERSANRRKENEKSIKMNCSGCGVHIRFERERLGEQVDCPQCGKSIKLRSPESLKMSCYFCDEHIEFPAHAIGEKLKCPHCHSDITLEESICAPN